MKLADGLTVRNEFFECDVDSQTGGIRSFRDLRTRLTRFGQQLVYNPGSKMVARDIAVTNSGDGARRDRQHRRPDRRPATRCWPRSASGSARGSAGPFWNCASNSSEARADRLPVALRSYAARFGWRDDRAVLFRGVNGANTQTGYTRPVSPDYLEVRTRRRAVVPLHGRLAVHPAPREPHGRCDPRSRGRTADARSTCSSRPIATCRCRPPSAGCRRLAGRGDGEGPAAFRNVRLAGSRRHAEPAPDGDAAWPPGENANRAVSARFIETSGFGGAAEIRFARDPFRASLIDGNGACASTSRTGRRRRSGRVLRQRDDPRALRVGMIRSTELPFFLLDPGLLLQAFLLPGFFVLVVIASVSRTAIHEEGDPPPTIASRMSTTIQTQPLDLALVSWLPESLSRGRSWRFRSRSRRDFLWAGAAARPRRAWAPAFGGGGVTGFAPPSSTFAVNAAVSTASRRDKSGVRFARFRNSSAKAVLSGGLWPGSRRPPTSSHPAIDGRSGSRPPSDTNPSCRVAARRKAPRYAPSPTGNKARPRP